MQIIILNPDHHFRGRHPYYSHCTDEEPEAYQNLEPVCLRVCYITDSESSDLRQGRLPSLGLRSSSPGFLHSCTDSFNLPSQLHTPLLVGPVPCRQSPVMLFSVLSGGKLMVYPEVEMTHGKTRDTQERNPHGQALVPGHFIDGRR